MRKSTGIIKTATDAKITYLCCRLCREGLIEGQIVDYDHVTNVIMNDGPAIPKTLLRSLIQKSFLEPRSSMRCSLFPMQMSPLKIS